MKFEEFIKKSYFLLEQDQASSESSPEKMKDAAKVLDKSGEQLTSQVEASQEQLVNLIKSLVEALMTEYRAEHIKLTPSIADALQNIKNSTLIPEPIEALKGIEEVVTKMSSDYKKPDTGI